jgi:hypothetical protein
MMIDNTLSHQPTWRYCRVRAGEKKPYPANWQNTPLTLEQVDSENIGLILGPKGNGVCAIDFDGTTAWEWLKQQGISNLVTTPTWTSGKPDRCQMAFKVPEDFWDVLETKKIVTKPASKPGAGDGEGFEFRWSGGQSVIPPSIHPQTQQPYIWLVDAQQELAEIPTELLQLWLIQISHKIARPEDTEPEVKLDDLTDKDIKECERILTKLKEKFPVLAYDEWRTVCWATAHFVGREAGGYLIRQFYPEQQRGEYAGLFRTWNKAKSPTIGSVLHMIGETKLSKREQHKQAYQQYLQEVSKLDKLRAELLKEYK